MIVAVSRAGAVTLEQRENFRGFHLSSAIPSSQHAQLAAALSAAGLRLEDQHAWISESWLLERGADLGVEWREELTAMLDYARQKGWFDEGTASVRVHVEWPENV